VTFDFNPEKHEFWVFVPGGRERRFSVTQILAHNGVCDYSFVDAETRFYAMQRGTSVHWLTQLEDQECLNHRKIQHHLRGYRKAWRSFKRNSGLLVTNVEQQFVSRYGYAGIIDRIGRFALGLPAVVDIKTGAIPNWVGYQLAAYAVWASGDDPSCAKYMRRIAVSLKHSGFYGVCEFPSSTFERDWSQFMQWVRSSNLVQLKDYEDEFRAS